MNHSIYSADRMTHLKVVVVALFAAIIVAGVGITARVSTNDGLMQTARSTAPVKASKAVLITSSDNAVVR